MTIKRCSVGSETSPAVGDCNAVAAKLRGEISRRESDFVWSEMTNPAIARDTLGLEIKRFVIDKSSVRIKQKTMQIISSPKSSFWVAIRLSRIGTSQSQLKPQRDSPMGTPCVKNRDCHCGGEVDSQPPVERHAAVERYNHFLDENISQWSKLHQVNCVLLKDSEHE